LKGYIDKDALRHQLPLEYAAAELGIAIDETGHAVCPFHDDGDPSFDFYVGSDGVQRWGCFPCGINGDVFDLIQRMEGVSFPDSINRAEDILETLPPGWAPAAPREPEAEVDPSTWLQPVQDAWARAQDPANRGMLSVYAGLLPPEAPDAEREEADGVLAGWAWGVDSEGNVLIPHITQDGQLTGVKVRSFRGDKWNWRGSKQPELYGSWIPQRFRQVLLTEGESDAVWAYLQKQPIDVRAMPAGANTFKERFVEQLDAWDTVYLALDPDEAGIRATRAWIELLGNAKVRVCVLPRGKDLRDAQPDLRTLLENAVEPPIIPPTIKTDKGYFERKFDPAQPPKQLTSWTATPVARLVRGDADEQLEPAWELDVDFAGHRKLEVITARDLNSAAKLKQWVGEHGYDCLAGDTDVAALQSWLTAKAAVLPEVYQTARLGIHEPPVKYEYAGRTLVLPGTYIGKLPWKYVSKIKRDHHVLLQDSGPLSWQWITDMLQLHDEASMRIMLAWFAASIRRVELKEFPLLFVGGASGSGKSTIAQLLSRMLGSNLKLHLSSATPFPVLQLFGATTTIPVFFDEWSRQSVGSGREALQGAIPFIYEGAAVTRGRQDLSQVEYQCTSPIVVAGEDAFVLDREAERMITIQLTRAAQNFEALQRLQGAPLERFGHWYNRWALEASLPELPNSKYSSRPEYNQRVLQVGWDTLRAFMEYAALYDPSVPDLPDLDLSVLNVREDERVNEYVTLIEAALGMTDGSGNDVVWEDPSGEGTWVRMQAITSSQFLNRLDVKPPGGWQSMKRYFEGLGFSVESRRTALPLAGRVMRAQLIKNYFMEDEREEAADGSHE
jgi:hypothetical protein